MKNHTGHIRGFHITAKAYYASSMPESHKNDITFGMYAPEGGTSGEMTMKWVEVGGKLAPQLRVFDDAFSALGLFHDVIDELALVDNENISQDQFANLLTKLGFEDRTAYKTDKS